MGKDIHMNLVNGITGEIVRENIFDGRNREWFDNMSGRGNDVEYEYLPVSWNYPDEIELDKETLREQGYFDFRYINAKEFLEWCEKYKPYLNAAWVSTRDEWLFKVKHIPIEEYYYEMPTEGRVEDWHFVVFENDRDCSNWLSNYIFDIKDIDYENLWIIYYFCN